MRVFWGFTVQARQNAPEAWQDHESDVASVDEAGFNMSLHLKLNSDWNMDVADFGFVLGGGCMG